jgi:HSP20 family protein
MPFFPQHALFPEATLYQILSSLEEPTAKSAACQPRRRQPQPQPQPTFTPKFDVVEVATAYELYGELPGVEQADVEIEFTDAQTIVIKGKSERVIAASEEVKEKDVDIASSSASSSASSEKSYAATVEDDYDEADAPIATPSTTTTATATATATAETAAAPAPTTAPQPTYWVTERRVGTFARSFSFAQRIEHDGVQASLKNGILRVVVPKSTKTGKVVVSVF